MLRTFYFEAHYRVQVPGHASSFRVIGIEVDSVNEVSAHLEAFELAYEAKPAWATRPVAVLRTSEAEYQKLAVRAC